MSISMIWSEIAYSLYEHHSFGVLSRTPISRWRSGKSASMKLKLSIMINLMLIMRERDKVCPYL